MLDIITCSTSFFKCVNDCGTTPDGVRSNHYAVQMVLLNPFIKSSQTIVSSQSLTGKTLKIPELNGKFNLILQIKQGEKNMITRNTTKPYLAGHKRQ